MKAISDNCTCLNYTKTFECEIIGSPIGATVWRGTAFDCEVDTVINLLHNQFTTPTGAFGSCNNGAIVAQSLRVENNRYVSELNVAITSDVIGESIECVHDDGGVTTVIGQSLITPTVGKTLICECSTVVYSLS